jgi:subtilisin
MAEKAEKEDRATSTGASRRGAAESTDDKRAAIGRASSGQRLTGNGRTSQVAGASRRQQYLIALRRLDPGFQPQSIDAVVDYLGRQDDVEIIARQKPAGAQPFAPDGSFAQEIVVARATEPRAENLRLGAQPYCIVERDAPLSPTDGTPVPSRAHPCSLLPLAPRTGEIALRIMGERDQPVARAAVVVYGPGFPIQAVTDEAGNARFSLFGGGPEQVRAIYIKPQANHWERFVVNPELNESGATTIGLRSLSETFPRFPQERLVQWGQRLMHTDLPGNMTGAGIRVGIIDSGCDNSHPSLRHITRGKDFSREQGETRHSDGGWTDDILGYGTHSTGLLAAAPASGQGLAGIAPEAEVHALKVFPGGRLSDLLATLDECIVRELDVVCLNVGCEEPSELLDQKLREMRHKGIACIAAATSSIGPQPFPAAQSSVLAVGAIGKLREYPADTFHGQAVIGELIGNEGIFPAAFTGAGPHVALSAPGVAVLSTVPGGYAALDGTGIAAAQATGLAVLILAHHPLLQGALRARTEQRVAALFGLLRASAVPHFADPLRGGAGVPDLQRVPGLHGTTTDLRAFAAMPMAGQMPGVEPFPAGYGIDPYLQNWQALMQMRAAGLI